MFEFKIIKEAKKDKARIAEFSTPHGKIETPVFMPVGTRGTVKGLTRENLEEMGTQIILANTYHLYLRPGQELIKKMGGLHKFMNWPHPILTDSGGFQIFSLGAAFNKSSLPKEQTAPKNLVKIKDDGVEFRSVYDGSKHFLTPSKAIEIQHALGADIIMAFDECPAANATKDYVKESMLRTHRWALECKETHLKLNKKSRVKKALFPIIQGGMFKDLRIESAKFMAQLDLPGIAIGGLAVGEARKTTWKIVDSILPYLPKNKPRYMMGIGTPEDLTEAVKRGIDMFDCVLPTRLGRHGSFFNEEGTIHIKNENNKYSKAPLDKKCECKVCQNYSRAYLRHLIMEKELTGLHLLSYHNVAYLIQLVNKLKSKI